MLTTHLVSNDEAMKTQNNATPLKPSGLFTLVFLVSTFFVYLNLQQSTFNFSVASDFGYTRIIESSVVSNTSEAVDDTGLYNVSDKPIFVLHIGPHKTATSTLQCLLTFFRSELNSHGIQYLARQYGDCVRENEGPVPHLSDSLKKPRRMIACLDRHSAETPCQETDTWRQFFKHIGKRKTKTLFMFDEAFARLENTETGIALFANQVKKTHHLRLALNTRRYFDWMPSMYNEKIKKDRSREWGDMPESITDYWRTFNGRGGYRQFAWEQKVHPVRYLYNIWRPHVDSAAIYDIHKKTNDTLYDVLRTILPQNTLNASWTREVKEPLPSRANPSVDVDYDLLAFKAYKNGWIKPRKNKRDVISAMQKAIPFDIKALATVCLTELELDRMLQLSLEFDKSIPGAHVDEKAYRSGFQGTVAKRKFCNVDAEEAMKNTTIERFFRSLSSVDNRIEETKEKGQSVAKPAFSI